MTQAEAAVGIAIEGRNPVTNRVIEKTELKKLCITMMTGEHFKRYDAMTEPPGDSKRPARVAGKSVRKYTLRRYLFFFKEIEAKSAEFSTPR